MKIVVTGANGFIGGYVIKELLRYPGNHIIAASIEKTDVKSWGRFKNVKYIHRDLDIPHKNYFQFFKEPDRLIHLAWSGLPHYSDLFHIEKNLYSNYFFIKNIIRGGLKNILVAGTCFEYGMSKGCLSEEMETRPMNAYGLAKDTLRRFVEELSKKYLFVHKWVRIFYVYGKGQSQNAIIPQLERALARKQKIFNMSKGNQVRDYLPVEKIAEYIVKIALQNKINGVINCCSGKPITIRRLVETYLKEHHQHINLNLGYYPYPKDEPMAFWGDNRKLRKILAMYEEKSSD